MKDMREIRIIKFFYSFAGNSNFRLMSKRILKDDGIAV